VALAPHLAHATTLDQLLDSWYDHELVALVETVCAQAPTSAPLDSLTVAGAAYEARWREIQEASTEESTSAAGDSQ
jgi:hypothetical protein